MEQRGEPPSWLPDGGQPRTGAAADLRNPEADEAAAGTPDGDSEYSYSGSTPYPGGQDTTYGQAGTTAGGYNYDAGPAGDATSAVPPYPASLTEPAGGTGNASTAKTSPSKSPGSADSPPSAAKDDGRNRTTTFSAVARGRYKRDSGSPAGAPAGAAAVGGAAAAARPGSPAPARRADLVVSRLEPWSVMKFSFLMSLVAWVVLFVAVAFLYFVLSSLGVFTSIQHTLTSVTSSSGSSGTQLSHWFSASRVLGYTMLLGAVNIVLITALSTVGAMIYNLVTHLGGGIEVTLRETD
ncbi:MAG: hypothetical protein QOG05_764 [Streptosporangiaceae bacterium]|nr:hypothetical protein [Streptosporangiaceae bacterium]